MHASASRGISSHLKLRDALGSRRERGSPIAAATSSDGASVPSVSYNIQQKDSTHTRDRCDPVLWIDYSSDATGSKGYKPEAHVHLVLMNGCNDAGP